MPDIYEKLQTYIKNILYFDVKTHEYLNDNPYQELDYYFSHLNHKSRGYQKSSCEIISESGYMGVSWYSHTERGRSTWDSDLQLPAPNFVSKEIYLLTDIFEKVCPELKFSQYRIIMNKLNIQEDTVTHCEEYGNDIVYRLKYFPIKNLIDALKELNISLSEQFLDEQNQICDEKKTSSPRLKIK